MKELNRSILGRDFRVRFQTSDLGTRLNFRVTRKPKPRENSRKDRHFAAGLPRLNIGGGKGHPKVEGWTVVDLRNSADIKVDITKDPLPYKDGEAAIVFSSHTIEHIYPQQLEFVLKEFRRVLQPGGLVRILVPDIEKAIRAYMEKDLSFFESSDITPFSRDLPIGGLLANWFYSTRRFSDPVLKNGEGHVHCFDFEYLKFWLERVGFTDVERSTFRGSSCPELRDEAFDRHPNESLFVEAIVPQS